MRHVACGVSMRSTGLLGYHSTISPVLSENSDAVAGHSMQKFCVNLEAMKPSLYAPSAGDLAGAGSPGQADRRSQPPPHVRLTGAPRDLRSAPRTTRRSGSPVMLTGAPFRLSGADGSAWSVAPLVPRRERPALPHRLHPLQAGPIAVRSNLYPKP